MAVLQQELTLGEAADQLARVLPGHPDPQRFKRGQDVAVPESVGVRVELLADTLLDG